MPIHATTKTVLTTFAEAQGFEILDSTAARNNQCWSLACNNAEREHDPFDIRIDALKQHQRKGSNIVCPHCKLDTKIEKFCARSNAMLHVTHEDNYLAECNDCHLTYLYGGTFYHPFHCFCNLRTRVQEHAFYKELHSVFPGKLAREVLYVDNHKADIALYLEDKTIFIEIDEIGHLYSPKKEQDELFEAHFEEQRQEHEFLYRLDDRFIMDDPEESVAAFLEYLETL